VQTSPARPSAVSIPELRAAVRGRVIAPGDPEYDTARSLFYGGMDRHPAALVRVADSADVSRVVTLARDSGSDLAVRSGGHSSVGHSVWDSSIVVDLAELKGLDIDPSARTAWAGTGLTAVEYSTSAAAHGLGTGFGDTGSVGIGGITLGGGVGYLARKHGLTIDSLLAADVVTADGQLLRTDADNHPDLFWAIRGGGGNFGVATRFQYRLHDVSGFVGGMLMLPADANVVASFIEAAEAAPEELTTIANVMPAPPMPFLPAEHYGRLVVMALMAWTGDPVAGNRAMAPFRALAEPIVDMVQAMHYPQIYPPEDQSYHPTAVGRTMFVDSMDRDVAATIVDYLEGSDASLRATQLRVLGGAVSRVPAGATAYAHRASRIMVNLAAFYEGPEDRGVRDAWVARFAAALRQGDEGAYVNFLNDEGGDRVRAAYPGATWDRLSAIKARYDPTNLFHLNQNIPPASMAAR